MANYENLVKLRRMIAEFKIYILRTQTYLAPVQLFMIFLIFLNTTVWNLSTIQEFFGSKMNLIVIGTALFIISVLLLGYIDTKLKMFRAEQGQYNNPDRNPFTPLFVLWTVLLLKDKKELNSDLEQKINCLIKDFGAEKMYDDFKKKYSSC